jgi:long-chain acyl-CoA synthetase
MTAALIADKLSRSGAEIDARATRLAGGLVSLGIEDGDVVAVMLRNIPAFVDLIQACRIAGAYYCQINWHFKRDEAGHILADCGAKVLIIQPNLLAEVSSVVPPHVQVIVVDAGTEPNNGFETWLAAQTAYAGPLRTPRGHMAYTSGTTGRPKGVRRLPLTAEQQALSAQVAKEALGIYPGVRSLLSAPLYHSAPSSFAQQSLLQGSGPDRTPSHRHRLSGAGDVCASAAPARRRPFALRPVILELRRLDRIALRPGHQKGHDRLARPGGP